MTAATACRTCGTELLANARFCHGCGSTIVGSETHAEYKQVTVLFADVVRSMDIASCSRAGTAPARSWPSWLDRCGGGGAAVRGARLLSSPATASWRSSGHQCRLEDHAVRACLAALGVQEEAKSARRRSQKTRDGVDLRLRVGLELGSGDRR